MNDHQEFHQFLYGRKAEVECLQAIVQNVLTRGNHFCSNEKECVSSCSTNEGEESPVERNCDMNFGARKTSCCEANTTKPSKSKLQDGESDSAPSDAISSACNTSDCQQDDCKNPCQIVLVCGPEGSGKRTFVRATFQLYGGALYSAGHSNAIHNTTTVMDRSEKSTESHKYILTSGRFRHSGRYTENRSVETTSDLIERDTRQLVAFDDAFQEIFDVLKTDKDMLDTIRRKLMHALDSPDSDISLLVESFPCLHTWLQLDSQPLTAIQPFNGDDKNGITSYLPTSTQRMHVINQQTQLLCRILTRFVRVISSVIPIVFILEDLQYADAASLMLIEEILTCNEHPDGLKPPSRILLVTTYTMGANVKKSSALTSFLKRYQSRSMCTIATVDDELTTGSLAVSECSIVLKTSPLYGQRICITEYSWEDVHQWIHECGGNIQKCTTAQKQELTHLVFHSSNGNPTRIRYLLEFLENDASILSEDINKKRLPKSMNDIFTSVFLQQDKSVQYMLKIASALAHCGLHDIGCNVLDVSVSQPCIDNVLIAERCGLLEYVPAGRYVKFYSREIEIAIYRQIPSPDRSSFHLEIGRRIWRNASLDQTKETKNSIEVIGNVVLATFQFRCVANMLTDFDECLYMSKSCYEVGKEALFYKDFDLASKLFEFSIYVLGQNIWRDDLYETSLVIHNAAAQAYCYLGEYNCLQRILDAIFDHAITFRDKLPAFVTLVYFQGSWHQLREAFRTAAATLKELGEPIKQNPSDLSVAWSLIKTKLKLMGKSIDFLVNLPIVDNEIDLIVAQLLCFASIYSYVVKPETSVLLCFRLIRLAIEKGTSGPSAVAFSTYGFVLCAMGSFNEGYQYGLVALKLAHKFEVWRPRIYTFVYGYVYQWTHPFRDCIAPLQEAAQSAIVSGDLEIYAGSSFFLNECSFFTGKSLLTLESLVRSHCQSIAIYGHLNPLMSLVPQWSFLKDLTCNEELLNLPGDITDAESAFKYSVKEGNKYVVGGIYVFRTIWHCLIGDYKEALEMARKAVEQRKISDYALTFYEGLAAVSIASTLKSQRRQKFRNLGQVMAKRLRLWTRRCSDNFLNKQLLLDAEIAGLNGKTSSAISLYQRSIDKAAEQGFIHEEGVAYERLGHYQLHLGRKSDATKSFASARNAFDKWGAIRLVRHLDQILATM